MVHLRQTGTEGGQVQGAFAVGIELAPQVLQTLFAVGFRLGVHVVLMIGRHGSDWACRGAVERWGWG